MKKAKRSKKSIEKEQRKEKRNAFLDFYDKKYKVLMLIPIIMLVLAIGQIAYQVSTTGDFMNKGVALKGGATITFSQPGDIGVSSLEETLKLEFPGNDVNVRELSGQAGQSNVIVEADITEQDQIETFTTKISELTDVQEGQMNIDIIGSSLGNSFFRQTFTAIIIAFILMGIVVFLYFRTFIPSMAVIISALTDIVITLAIINIIDMKLSTAGIAALLMLIGYSIDTDILLTTRILKEKGGTVFQRTVGAMKTGMTMSLSTLAAVTVGLLISQSDVLTQIMTIIFIGLVVDIINTWIQNVGILRYYLEKKKVSQ